MGTKHTPGLLDTLRRIDQTTVGAFATNSSDLYDWREDMEAIQILVRAAIAIAKAEGK